MVLSVGVVAHDRRKREMADWLAKHKDVFANMRIFATAPRGGFCRNDFLILIFIRLKAGRLAAISNWDR